MKVFKLIYKNLLRHKLRTLLTILGFTVAVMAYALERAGSTGGTAVGTYQAFMDLGMGLGPVVMGIILPLTGYRIMFLGLALTCLINLCYFQFYVRKRNSVARTV